MAQKLKLTTGLEEDTGSIPSTHIDLGDLMISLSTFDHLVVCV